MSELRNHFFLFYFVLFLLWWKVLRNIIGQERRRVNGGRKRENIKNTSYCYEHKGETHNEIQFDSFLQTFGF
jgi:hypothetical protein